MFECAKNPLVIPNCTVGGRLSEFQGLGMGLEKCQKSLNDYLDSKRRVFPRFYFISTDELLAILGGSEPTCVQEHMIKMFDNIKSLRFVNNSNQFTVTAMVSSESEVMEFRNVVQATGRVEDWLNQVLAEMRKTNRYLTKKAIFDYGKDREISRPEWIDNYQGMICLAANQVWWTAEVEEVFFKIKCGNKRAMKEFLVIQNKQLDDLVLKGTWRNFFVMFSFECMILYCICSGKNLVRTDLSSNDRLKFKTIVTIDVHARDIIEGFVRDNVMDAQEFSWESQLRFYWMKDADNLFINQCTGKFGYGYEYMGLNGRLVITPLTDRIYLTITQALSMYMGAAPSGPAGTGKTETTKDLAKAMALLCLVTNCGEGMDFYAIGTILAGLVQCGAWGCFDEFNRIDISVLSVISTQLQTIRNALMSGVERFMFEGADISVDNKVGIFITMNPGYAGRTELPESVKALFRPVTCIMPDKNLICLISLFSDGFATAKVLAKKITVLYKLAEEQLSKQCHYDWGLRSLNSVLRMAGVARRQSKDLSENVILMRVLRDTNYPKFVADDVPLFFGLIKDLFPGIEHPRQVYPVFGAAVIEALLEDGYSRVPEQEDKVVQMYETMMTRHSTMVVGPTGGGKSVVINTLIKAQNIMGLPTKCTVLNPKACTVIELYGFLDLNTRDWVDGLFSNIFRELNRPIERDERRYVCFDGDVDALWIENMNSVMDDNRLLTLANGERIRLESYCALLFEVGNLNFASPATVSRAGMVFLDPVNLRYRPYWERWMISRPSHEHVMLETLYERFVISGIDFIIEGLDGSQQGKPLKTIIPQTNLNMVIQFCTVFSTILSSSTGTNNLSPDIFECIFIETVYVSLGATLIESDRPVFDDFIKKQSGMISFEDSIEKPATTFQIPTAKPTLFEYFLDIEKQAWIAWEWIVPAYVHNRKMIFNEILVPTVDTMQISWILDLLVIHGKQPVLLVGETGTAKTAIVANYLRNMNPDVNIILNLNFSSRTSSMDVQRTIEASVEKRTKDVFGPPIGKHIRTFIDDMNMPQVDTYGTQQPIALLKLLFERGGMYDRDKDLNWKRFKDMTFVAAMGVAGGGRNEVDPRFISMFLTYNIVFPADKTLSHIYSSILKGHLEVFPRAVYAIAERLVRCTLNLFQKTLMNFPPTPSKFHYVFNLKDLSRICGGMYLAHENNFQEPKQLVRMWRNEYTRVMSDRLISLDDVRAMNEYVAEEIRNEFAMKIATGLKKASVLSSAEVIPEVS